MTVSFCLHKINICFIDMFRLNSVLKQKNRLQICGFSGFMDFVLCRFLYWLIFYAHLKLILNVLFFFSLCRIPKLTVYAKYLYLLMVSN